MGRLNELGEEILAINRANGWNVPVVEDWLTPADWKSGLIQMVELARLEATAQYKIPTSLSLIHSEVSEALEEFRKDHRLDKFMEELADVLIRTIELGVGLGGDLDNAVEGKLIKNRGRGQRHGGRLI